MTASPRVFGYGSLVNLATHSYPDPQPATLPGWRRVWHHTTLRPVAFLSVERQHGSAIQGITSAVPQGDWSALDAREAAYTRHDVTAETGAKSPVSVYEVSQGHLAPPSAAHPILLSYIDVVVQGYLQHFGPDGVAAFFDSTTGWDAPIHNDRATPLYPRAQRLSKGETDLVDTHLARVSRQPPASLKP